MYEFQTRETTAAKRTEDVDLRLKSVLVFRFLVLEESEDVRREFGRKSEQQAGR